MEVGGQPHTLATLTTRERPHPVLIEWEVGGPQSQLDILKKRKVPCQDSKPKSSSLAPLTYHK